MSVRKSLGVLAGTLILLAQSPLEAANPAAKDHSLEVVESGIATVQVGNQQGQISYSRTFAGPLFALQPLVPALGGELTIGPLRQKHELAIGNAVFLFGPGSPALTQDLDITKLSQAPLVGIGGLHVPVDLLYQLYGNLLGYDFLWKPTEKRLVIERAALRELPVTLDVVNLQGVTTLVFEFPERPRYRIARSGRQVSVELIGDTLAATSPRLFAADEFVHDVRLTPEAILIELAPRTIVEDYVLESPFRLVFDALRSTSSARRDVAKVPSRSSDGSRSGVRTIVIDPGHGGSDTGALGRNGSQEKSLTLTLARQLKARLEDKLGLRVVLTRTNDADVELDTRSALANQYKGDLFVSLHINSSPDRSAHGAETYFSSLEASDEASARAAAAANANQGDPLYDLQLILWDLAQSRFLAQSQNLASLVQAELNDALQLRNRGVKQAPFRVLLGAAMPAVLVELGFLSNGNEEGMLASSEYRSELTDALVRAISRYKATVEGQPIPDETELSSR